MKKTRLEMKFTALLMVGIVALQGPGQIVAAEEIFFDDSIVLSEEEDFLWNEVEEEGASEEGEQDGEEAGGLISDNADVSEKLELIEDVETQTESYTESYTEYTQDPDEYQFTTDERHFAASDLDNEPDSENSIEGETTSYEIETVDEDSLSTIEEEFVIEEELALDNQTVEPVSSGFFEGHRYAVYDYSLIWNEAEAFCENLGGHLATITSAEELAYIGTLIDAGGKYQYWLGATGIGTPFQWVTGEPFVFSNWGYGQPDHHSEEQYLQMYRVPSPHTYNSKPYEWNDIRKDNWFNSEETDFYALHFIGLICEWDSDISIKLDKEYTGVYNEEFYVSASVTSFSIAPSSSNFKWEVNLDDDKVEWGSMSVITVKEGEYIVSSPVTVKDAGKFEITAEFGEESDKSSLKVKPGQIKEVTAKSGTQRELSVQFEEHPCADGYIIKCTYKNSDEEKMEKIHAASGGLEAASEGESFTWIYENGKKYGYYKGNTMPRADQARIKVCAYVNVKDESAIEGEYSSITYLNTGNQISAKEMWGFDNPDVIYTLQDYLYLFSPEAALECYSKGWGRAIALEPEQIVYSTDAEKAEYIKQAFYGDYDGLADDNTFTQYKHSSGVCFGMVEAAIAAYCYDCPGKGAFGVKNLYRLSSIDEAKNYICVDGGLTAEQCIKYAHLVQGNLSSICEMFDSHAKNYLGLLQAIKECQNGTGSPVHVSLQQGPGAHSLEALGIAEETDSFILIDVYDCNHEGDKSPYQVKLIKEPSNGEIYAFSYGDPSEREYYYWDSEEGDNPEERPYLSYATETMSASVVDMLFAIQEGKRKIDNGQMFTHVVFPDTIASSKKKGLLAKWGINPIVMASIGPSSDDSDVYGFADSMVNLSDVPMLTYTALAGGEDAISVISTVETNVSIQIEQTGKAASVTPKDDGIYLVNIRHSNSDGTYSGEHTFCGSMKKDVPFSIEYSDSNSISLEGSDYIISGRREGYRDPDTGVLDVDEEAVIDAVQLIPAKSYVIESGEEQLKLLLADDLTAAPVSTGEFNHGQHTHSWSDWNTTLEPSCTEDGCREHTCKKCHKTESEAIPATGHAVVVDAGVPATETNTGLTEGSHCSICGEVLIHQEIIPFNIDFSDKIKVTGISSHTYDGKEWYPTVTVTYEGNKLEKDKDYSVQYVKMSQVGNTLYWQARISGKGRYTGGTVISYTTYTADISKASASANIFDIYTGKTNPSLTLKMFGKTLKESTDYYISRYSINRIGSYLLVFWSVEGWGNFAGTSKTFSFSLSPASVSLSKAKALKKKAKLTWKKKANISGYQIQYSTRKNFASAKTKTVAAGKTSLTIKQLKSKKTYYFRIRSYIKTKLGVKYYGSWSKTKKVKVK